MPGETLYSLCARLDGAWGEHPAGTTTRWLFSHSRAGCQHDFPSRLDRLAARSGGGLGDAQTIASERTLLRFYQPFVAELSQEICTAMRGDSVAHLKLRLGILTSRFRANHPLKACLACMAVDRDTTGWAYWHLDHQYPGVWVCPRHPDQVLRVSAARADGAGRFRWHLPREAELVLPLREAFEARELEALRRLSQCVVASVAQADPGALCFERLRLCLREQLHHRGWLLPSGRLRLQSASSSLVDYCSVLRTVPELRGLPQTPEVAKAQLSRLVHPLRTGTHPVRYLVLVSWLFEEPRLFWQALESGAPPSHAKGEKSAKGRDTAIATSRDRAVELVKGGLSARAVARQLGVDTKTVLSWATQAGLCVKRRPKVLAPPVVKRLEKLLVNGAEVGQVALACGVSVSTVNTYLYARPEVLRLRKDVQLARARASARAEWEAALERVAGAGPAAARRRASAAYAWLRRHDLAWLRESMEMAPRAPRTSASTAEFWARWDDEVSAELECASDRLAALRKKICLKSICLEVPELWPKLRALARCPKTSFALRAALKRGSA